MSAPGTWSRAWHMKAHEEALLFTELFCTTKNGNLDSLIPVTVTHYINESIVVAVVHQFPPIP